MKARYFLFGIVAILVGLALSYQLQRHTDPLPHSDAVRITIGNGSVDADIADSEAEREQGLSGRATLTDTQGMLFVFDTPGYYAFWMKDMRFPIDMIWLDGDKKVVFIKADARPESYPASFTPIAPALYVLEVPAEWAWLHHVEVGSVAQFDINGTKN